MFFAIYVEWWKRVWCHFYEIHNFLRDLSSTSSSYRRLAFPTMSLTFHSAKPQFMLVSLWVLVTSTDWSSLSFFSFHFFFPHAVIHQLHYVQTISVYNCFKDAQRIAKELRDSFANDPDRIAELRRIEQVAEHNGIALNLICRLGTLDPSLKVSFEFTHHPYLAVAVVKRSWNWSLMISINFDVLDRLPQYLLHSSLLFVATFFLFVHWFFLQHNLVMYNLQE